MLISLFKKTLEKSIFCLLFNFFCVIINLMKNILKQLCNVPNILSLLRLLCVPLFLVLFFVFSPNYIPALIVFVVASLTDVLDGFIARKCNLQTPLGTVLDPLADKLLKSSTLFAFAFFGIIQWWFFGVIFAIDLTMILTGLVLFNQQIIIPSNIIGKVGTFVMTIGLFMCFFPQVFAPWNEYILYIGLGIVISSAILYFALHYKAVFAKFKELKQVKKEDKQEWFCLFWKKFKKFLN